MTYPKTFIAVKFDEKITSREELTKPDTNTDSRMTYLTGLYFDGRKYMSMRNVRNGVGYGHRDRVKVSIL